MMKLIISFAQIVLACSTVEAFAQQSTEQPVTVGTTTETRGVVSRRDAYERKTREVYELFATSENFTGYGLSNDAGLFGEFETRLRYFELATEALSGKPYPAQNDELGVTVTFTLDPFDKQKKLGVSGMQNCALLNAFRANTDDLDADADAKLMPGTTLVLGAVPQLVDGWNQCVVLYYVTPLQKQDELSQHPDVTVSVHSMPIARITSDKDAAPVLTLSRTVPLAQFNDASLFLTDLSNALLANLTPVELRKSKDKSSRDVDGERKI